MVHSSQHRCFDFSEATQWFHLVVVQLKCRDELLRRKPVVTSSSQVLSLVVSVQRVWFPVLEPQMIFEDTPTTHIYVAHTVEAFLII